MVYKWYNNLISKFQNFLYTKIIIRNGLNGWAGGWVRLLREQGDLIWLISIMFPIPRFADIRKNNKSVTFDWIFCVKLGWQWARWPKRKGERWEMREERGETSQLQRGTHMHGGRGEGGGKGKGVQQFGGDWYWYCVSCELWVVPSAVPVSMPEGCNPCSVNVLGLKKIALYAIYVQISWMIFKGKLGGEYHHPQGGSPLKMPL